jgi:DNA adenine methylase
MQPFLKWAGGKRWLFKNGDFCLPEINQNYIEPFLGGGAVFFHLQPQNALLSDANGRLIELYQVIRDDHLSFKDLLADHAQGHSKEYYYETRQTKFETKLERAAQFMYLNRTCWNGLYRENKKGQFNVPIGTKDAVLLPNDDFKGWSKALRGKQLKCQDFEKSIDAAKDGDVIFVDPPYTVRHNMNGFVKYNQNIFAWEDQVRLRSALERAGERGAKFIMTNADHESIRDLYKNFGQHQQLSRHSVIAGKSAHRAKSTELMVSG